jgi:hypothetical protein
MNICGVLSIATGQNMFDEYLLAPAVVEPGRLSERAREMGRNGELTPIPRGGAGSE